MDTVVAEKPLDLATSRMVMVGLPELRLPGVIPDTFPSVGIITTPGIYFSYNATILRRGTPPIEVAGSRLSSGGIGSYPQLSIYSSHSRSSGTKIAIRETTWG